MNLIRPSHLQAGDKIAAVSPSWGGPGIFPHRYQIGKQQLEAEFGLEIIETKHALRDAAWLARNPRARADDLMEAFSDPSIKGIISTIGGEDSIRILRFLDLEIIKANPKIFLGYSDNTITHFACLKAGLVSFYGSGIMEGFAENGGLFPYFVNSVRKILFETRPLGQIHPNRDGWTIEKLDWADSANQSKRRAILPSLGWNFLQGKGKIQGPLIGGCLEVLDWLRGTDFWPVPNLWKGAILFLETSEEGPTPVTVARFLRSLAAMNILQSLSGILYGLPGTPVSTETLAAYDQAILSIVRDEEGLDEMPIITQMDFGHSDPSFILPYGVKAEIDCDGQAVSLLESAVI